MKFFGTGAVWNQSKNKMMMKFPRVIDKDGKKQLGCYETEDEHEISVLKMGGFKHAADPEVKEETVTPVEVEKKEEPKEEPKEEKKEEVNTVTPSPFFGGKK